MSRVRDWREASVTSADDPCDVIGRWPKSFTYGFFWLSTFIHASKPPSCSVVWESIPKFKYRDDGLYRFSS